MGETTAHNRMSEAEAAKAANAHAAACRAMPRGVPARPEDPETVELVRSRLSRHRYGTSPRRVHLSDFNAVRVGLQRSTPWIKALLESLTQAAPGFLTATPSDGQGTRYARRGRRDPQGRPLVALRRSARHPPTPRRPPPAARYLC
ncbi:hypothetical protein [Streptomyces sp. NPDC088180]|uniref:hypothetical protein n=1 Tax=Streptomyces sp. NPDC088180 TaxID=3365837 RepID=UPI0037FBDF7B